LTAFPHPRSPKDRSCPVQISTQVAGSHTARLAERQDGPTLQTVEIVLVEWRETRTRTAKLTKKTTDLYFCDVET